MARASVFGSNRPRRLGIGDGILHGPAPARSVWPAVHDIRAEAGLALALTLPTR